MKISSLFTGKYLKAEDIPIGQQVAVTIDRVEIEDVAGNDNPADKKPVLYFIGKQKGLVLNKTNSSTISAVYGDETEGWRDQTIKLFQSEVMFQGVMTPCLRVTVPQAEPAQEPNQPANEGVPAAQTQRANQAAPAGDIPF